MKTNVAVKAKTHEGGRASKIKPIDELRRSVLSCMLFEDTFYEDGVDIAKRISDLVPRCRPDEVAALAVTARNGFNLRHAPLWLTLAMCRSDEKYRRYVGDVLRNVVQRPDEITEFLAMYWKDKKVPLAAQVKKGLGGAFRKFNEYQLAKYNRDGAIKLRDALFLTHPKPENDDQAALWKRLVDGTLATPDTWEVGISAAKTKDERKEIWTRLLAERKLGALALLRNLRNMQGDGVDPILIAASLRLMDTSRVFPYRFLTAARYNPHLEEPLEEGMIKSAGALDKLPGRTVLLVDVSGSMDAQMSNKSEETRLGAANGIAILCREICENVKVYSFSNGLAVIPNRRGFALSDAIDKSQPHGGTALGEAINRLFVTGLQAQHAPGPTDRLIVITDEQASDRVPSPDVKRKYIINVAPYKNGVGYGNFVHVNGFSESVVRWIGEYEKSY